MTANGQRLWAAEDGLVAAVESLIWRQYWDVRPRLEQDWTRFVEHLMEQKDEAERQQYQAALAKVRAIHRRVRAAAVEYLQEDVKLLHRFRDFTLQIITAEKDDD